MKTAACLIIPLLIGCAPVHAEDLATAGEHIVEEPVFGGEVYIYEAGTQQEETVVLVNGVGDEGFESWVDLIPVLAERFHVVAFDLPGFGLSAGRNKLYSPANYARFIQWIVDEYAAGPVCVVGHSLGGAISLYFAGTYPGSLERLVLVDVAGILHRVPYVKSMLQNRVASQGTSGQRKGFLRACFSVLRRLIEDVDHAFVPGRLSVFLKNPMFREAFLGGDPRAISGAALIDTDFSKVIGNVNVPVSIIWGDRDPVAPLRTGKVLAAGIPQASLHVMKDTGHSPMLERPEAFQKLLFRCLEEEPIRTESPSPVPHNRGIVRVAGKKNFWLRGAYDRIDIVGCQAIRLSDVTARQINIEDSSVGIESSVITSDDVGIRSIDSVLMVTGTTVKAAVAILAANSRIDLAGVRLQGSRASIDSIRESTVVFSVCRAVSPHSNRYMHGIVKVDRDHPI